ncbi:SDR family oxidoreductase [Catenovulum maritimum]|uniref:SDR family oxidoreductase n=1 Tax=Catenovulum maritimum TaxID=1513271 RepID=UPI00069CD735|nr:SDR family oxidoreductase [Catenovulum maritimum]
MKPLDCILISSAGSDIAASLYLYWRDRYPDCLFVLVSRAPISYDVRSQDLVLKCDLSQPDQKNILVQLLKDNQVSPDWTICCSGFLHDNLIKPEKSLTQFSIDNFMCNLQANLLVQIHLSQVLNLVLNKHKPAKFICLSARVSSISDNHLGGWHSYRMSKAALNMWLKNLAIEWQRKFPLHAVASLHPGTTDTKLSLPFQQNIKPDKLYAGTLTAERIDRVFNLLSLEDSGALLNWDGNKIAW